MRCVFHSSAARRVLPTRSQAGTYIMVELGDGKRLFFVFGNGALRNLVAMQVPIHVINDIFLTHLHADHYADLSYLGIREDKSANEVVREKASGRPGA